MPKHSAVQQAEEELRLKALYAKNDPQVSLLKALLQLVPHKYKSESFCEKCDGQRYLSGWSIVGGQGPNTVRAFDRKPCPICTTGEANETS